MDLAVRLVPEQSCWVALPPQLLHQLSQAHDVPAPLLVEARVLGQHTGAPPGPFGGYRGQGPSSLAAGLSPRTTSVGAHASVYLGWGGAVSSGAAVEVPQALGESLGLRTGQQLRVWLRPWASLAQGDAVQVEPEAVDDWETLELNPGHLEDSILHQVGVLAQGQRFTVWVHGQSCVRLRVLSCSPAPLVRLGPGTELIVSPKDRSTAATGAGGQQEVPAGGAGVPVKGGWGPGAGTGSGTGTSQADAPTPKALAEAATPRKCWLRVQEFEPSMANWHPRCTVGTRRCHCDFGSSVLVSPGTAAWLGCLGHTSKASEDAPAAGIGGREGCGAGADVAGEGSGSSQTDWAHTWLHKGHPPSPTVAVPPSPLCFTLHVPKSSLSSARHGFPGPAAHSSTGAGRGVTAGPRTSASSRGTYPVQLLVSPHVAEGHVVLPPPFSAVVGAEPFTRVLLRCAAGLPPGVARAADQGPVPHGAPKGGGTAGPGGSTLPASIFLSPLSLGLAAAEKSGHGAGSVLGHGAGSVLGRAELQPCWRLLEAAGAECLRSHGDWRRDAQSRNMCAAELVAAWLKAQAGVHQHTQLEALGAAQRRRRKPPPSANASQSSSSAPSSPCAVVDLSCTLLAFGETSLEGVGTHEGTASGTGCGTSEAQAGNGGRVSGAGGVSEHRSSDHGVVDAEPLGASLAPCLFRLSCQPPLGFQNTSELPRVPKASALAEGPPERLPRGAALGSGAHPLGLPLDRLAGDTLQGKRGGGTGHGAEGRGTAALGAARFATVDALLAALSRGALEVVLTPPCAVLAAANPPGRKHELLSQLPQQPLLPFAPQPQSQGQDMQWQRGGEERGAGGPEEGAADVWPELQGLPWLQAPGSAVLSRLALQLSGPLRAHRMRAGLPAVGAVVLSGGTSSGKTALCAAVARRLRQDPACLAHVEHVACAELAHEQAAAARMKLVQSVRRASARLPAVVVLDDLDALVAAGAADSGGDANVDGPTTRLLGVLSDLVDTVQSRDLPWAFLASVKQYSHLPSLLRLPGRFDFQVEIPPPGQEQRAQMLASAVRRRWAWAAEEDVALVSAKCHGFEAGDVTVLVDRAVALAAARRAMEGDAHTSLGLHKSKLQEQARSPLSSGAAANVGTLSDGANVGTLSDGVPGVGGPSPSPTRGSRGCLEVSQADFVAALDGFVPVALRSAMGAGAPAAEGEKRSWADVGGLASVCSTLREILELPARQARVFGGAPLRLRTGVLLFGPPGCGKTHVVGVAADACGLRCISVKGPELLNKYIGASEQGVRDVFARAARASPCILFFDEFDAIAPKRGHDNTGVTDRVVNQLLTELDGVEGLEGVFVVAATSRPDLIDAALLRPGRLDRLVMCDFPTALDRESILAALSRSLSLAPGVDLAAIAAQADGFTGADLQALLSDAQLAAVHRRLEQGEHEATGGRAEAGGPQVGMQDLLAQLQSARPSVTAKERHRLTAIYDEFLGSKSVGISKRAHMDKGKRATLA